DAEASPLFADPAPHPERRDEVPAAKRERDARRTLLLPPRVTGEAPEGFFAPTVSHDDNGLVFVSQADLADSLGSGVDEEEDAPRSWRGKLKAAWRSMPWFKDIHAEGSTEDDLVARLQTGAEVFDTETELFFSACQVVSACMGCIAHSANDTANAIGPFAAILTVYQSGSADSEIGSPWYILLFGGLSMSLGLALLGYRVIKTVGVKLVKITPARGFSMELGAAWTVLIFSAIGIPLSTTHCAVGSTVGVGLMEPKHPRRETGDGPVAEGEEPKKRAVQCPVINTASVNWKLFGGVFVSWIITIAFSALVTAALFSFAAYSPRMVSK
ncbi:putative phosphate transporter family protein, partial [Toxoplasma gondii p89]